MITMGKLKVSAAEPGILYPAGKHRSRPLPGIYLDNGNGSCGHYETQLAATHKMTLIKTEIDTDTRILEDRRGWSEKIFLTRRKL